MLSSSRMTTTRNSSAELWTHRVNRLVNLSLPLALQPLALFLGSLTLALLICLHLSCSVTLCLTVSWSGASNPVSTSSPLSHAPDLGPTSFHRQASTDALDRSLLQSSLLHQEPQGARHSARHPARQLVSHSVSLARSFELSGSLTLALALWLSGLTLALALALSLWLCLPYAASFPYSASFPL